MIFVCLSFYLSNSGTGTTPVTSFKRGQTIYFMVKYTVSATGNVLRVYSNPTWPTTISNTLFFTTASQPAGSYSTSTSFLTSTSNPTGSQTALMEVAVSGGNLAIKTVKYTITT